MSRTGILFFFLMIGKKSPNGVILPYFMIASDGNLTQTQLLLFETKPTPIEDNLLLWFIFEGLSC